MTDTIAAQNTFIRPTDDPRIVTTPPSTADAQLILQLMQVNASTGANDGWQLLLHGFETPPTRTQLLRKYPRESAEYGQIQAFLAGCETMATFVRQGILNEALVHDVFWIAGAWQRSEKICKAMRKEAGEPRIMENFEWLANRAI